MTTPLRIQLSRRKGFRVAHAAANGLLTVKVDRTTKWGNPFNFKSSDHCWTALAYGCRGDAPGRQKASIIAFRGWISPRPEGKLISTEFQVVACSEDKKVPIGPKVEAGAPPSIDEIRAELRGKNLAYWCAPPAPGEPDICHAAVLLEIANAPEVAGG